MEIYEVDNRNDILIKRLVDIWESSVLKTHNFLSKDDFYKIKEYVPKYLKIVEHLIVAKEDSIVGFIGINNKKIEMLFIDAAFIGKKIGEYLTNYVISNYNANEVTVNEDNIKAVGFYEHLGFRTYNRTDFDEEGNPYPLLYMKLIK